MAKEENIKKEVKEEKKEKKEKKEQALENKCPACNASISFKPKLGKWKCDYCGSEFTLEEMQQHEKNASTKKKNEQTPVDDFDGYINYKCESCGAEIVADEETAATFCVYCGNTAILKSKLSGKFTPSRIIPFKKEKKEAIECFKNLSKGRPLMPKDFNNEKNIEKLRGIYIPFWLFDINVSGDIVMNGQTVETWTRGDTHYTKTNNFLITRGGTMDFSHIPQDGSTHFDDDMMNSIEPFRFDEMIPYNHAYLSGFYAEKYDVDDEETLKLASTRALNTARNILQDDAKLYASKIITQDHLESKELKNEYVLLPVWMVNVKYNDKMHIFAMNGQTGEFIGNIPLDKTKAFLYAIIIFVILFIICFIGSYILFMLGGM